MIKNSLINIFGIISLLGFIVCGIWIFVIAPIETTQGYSQKIMYLHVPSVISTYIAFFIVFIFSIAYLWKRDKTYDFLAKASAEVGLLFCAMVLITGAIWGKPTWGTFWVWDARLTTTLLLFLIFVGYFILRFSIIDPEKEARFAAVIGIIGFLDIPIIHKSVEWWRTLHQPTTLFKIQDGISKPSIPKELLNPLLFCMLTMLIFYTYLLFLRYKLEITTEKYNEALSRNLE